MEENIISKIEENNKRSENMATDIVVVSDQLQNYL